MLWAMRLGCFLLAAQHPGMSHADALETALEAAVAAEQAGLDSAWIAEHHFISYGVCPSAATFAANLLGRTRRLVVGTAVAVLSNQHPIALAEQTALLDHLSGGRFHLGVGRGGPYVDLEVFDTGVERYQHGFAEALDLLLRWLEQDRVRGDGQRFSFREVTVVPRPVTRPRPPVTVACTSATRPRPPPWRATPRSPSGTATTPGASSTWRPRSRWSPTAAPRQTPPCARRCPAGSSGGSATTPTWSRRAPAATRATMPSTCSRSIRSAPPRTAPSAWPPARSAPASATSCSWSRAVASGTACWTPSPGSGPRCDRASSATVWNDNRCRCASSPLNG